MEAKQANKGGVKRKNPEPVEVSQKNTANNQTDKLTNQIAVLKDHNKCLEEKVQVKAVAINVSARVLSGIYFLFMEFQIFFAP